MAPDAPAARPSGAPDATVLVCGQGYVGLPIAMRSVAAGMSVVGYEIAEQRVASLAAGRSYVEDIASEELQGALDAGRYHPTSALADCKDFDVAVITVPTPLREGLPDLRYIEQCAADLGPLVRPGCTVILESTTYPGTTEELVAPVLARRSGLTPGRDFALGYSPERIDPGNPTWHLGNTPKVVSGIDPASTEAVAAFYRRIVDTVVPVSSTRVAELCKLLENTFRHVNIALVNELAMFADVLAVDVWEAIDAAATKPFGFMPFRPGPGVGGHCLPVDPSYLSWKVRQSSGSPFRFIELANEVNDHMPQHVAQRAAALLNLDRKAVNGSTVVVLGLAYKPASSDLRESPGPVLCGILTELGATVVAVDPMVDPDHFPAGVGAAELSRELLDGADLVIVVTDHPQFDWTVVASTATTVFDTRHRLPRGPGVVHL